MFVDGNIGWLGGANGTILFTDDGGGTVGIKPPVIPGLKESLTAHPNPFKNSVTLKYDSDRITDPEIIITNMLGMTVYSGHLNRCSGDPLTFTWQPEGLPEGLYICILKDGERTCIARIMHVK